MNQMLGYERMHYAAGIIGRNIPDVAPEEMSADVSEMLKRAKAQMMDFPAALDGLEAARRNFNILDHAIDRLLDLASEAMNMPEDQISTRKEMQVEFDALAGAIADVAGRDNYRGPQLSVMSIPQARAAYQALKNLTPVKSLLKEQLREQEDNIIQAVHETLDFLEVVADAYPTAASTRNLTDLLQRVKWVREACRPVVMAGSA